MALHRHSLPQLDGAPFLADGGLETFLVFLDGVELPAFAAFPLLADEEGRQRLRRYFEPYPRLAAERGAGFVLDTPTWRANADWGEKLGYDAEALAAINRASVAFAAELRDAFATERTPIVVNGVVGPRGDGYRVEAAMAAEEAIGVAQAAAAAGMPVAVSFTVETDGRLPSGQALRAAVEQVERATGGAPAYYMVNCAHPTHFEGALAEAGPWRDRIRGVRANASRKSHAELDAAMELDTGDPAELGRQYRGLRGRLPKLSVLGGCCGTDHRHIAAICDACL